MVKIRRTSCPNILKDAPTEGVRFKNPEVAGALRTMQHGKCCYCEERIPEEGIGKQIEHFRPRSLSPELINQWENLLLCCAPCNHNKSDRFPLSGGEPLVINPSDSAINPEEHIGFIVDDEDPLWCQIKPRENSRKGRESILVIGLHKKFHLEKRREHFKLLYTRYLDILTASDASARQASLASFEVLTGANSEFAALARAFARAKKLDQHGVNISNGWDVAPQEHNP